VDLEMGFNAERQNCPFRSNALAVGRSSSPWPHGRSSAHASLSQLQIVISHSQGYGQNSAFIPLVVLQRIPAEGEEFLASLQLP